MKDLDMLVRESERVTNFAPRCKTGTLRQKVQKTFHKEGKRGKRERKKGNIICTDIALSQFIANMK